MVNVAHDGNDRCTRHLNVIGVRGDELLEFLFDNHLFERHKAEIDAEIVTHFDRHFLADRLIQGRKDTALDQKLNDVTRRDPQCLGKFADRCPFRQTDRL